MADVFAAAAAGENKHESLWGCRLTVPLDKHRCAWWAPPLLVAPLHKGQQQTALHVALQSKLVSEGNTGKATHSKAV
jgi:hypothetical protein